MKKGSRKTKITYFTVILASVMAFCLDAKFIDWADMTVWIVGLYMGGNVGEHGAKAWKDGRLQQTDKKENT